MSALKGTIHRTSQTYNAWPRIRVADEDKVMSQQELTDYIMEQQATKVYGSAKFPITRPARWTGNFLSKYIHRGQEFSRINFDYSDRDTVLG